MNQNMEQVTKGKSQIKLKSGLQIQLLTVIEL